MIRTVLHYRALVCPNGYRWDGDLMVPVKPYDGFSLHEVSRFPLDEKPTLFLDFARLGADRAAFVAFANENGDLFLDGGTFDQWSHHVAKMRSHTELMLALQCGDEKAMRAMLSEDVIRLAGSVKEGARKALGIFFQYLLPVIPDPKANAVDMGFRFIPFPVDTDLGWHLSAVPESLAAGLWFQFAHAITDNKKFTFCPVCDKPLDISDEGSRIDRRYCGDACRQRKSRRQRKEAREMRTRGEHLRGIAAHFDVKMERVKQWLGE